MRRSKYLGLVATGLCALILGVGNAAATGSNGEHESDGARQYGKVENATAQGANSEATSEQKNFNVPFSYKSFGGFGRHGKGDKVSQFNKADTSSKAENGNKTGQSLKQDQKVDGNGHDCCHKSHGRWEGDKGGRGREGECCEHKGQGSASQYGTVSNETGQTADSRAENKQVNVNAPISIASWGSNNGDVNQYNKGRTSSKAENGNKTYQQAEQKQYASDKGKGCGCGGRGEESGGPSQKGKVENGTTQDANSTASNEQYNVNVPISVFSVGSNNGDVNQGNEGSTHSSSSNWNETGQSLNQSQHT